MNDGIRINNFAKGIIIIAVIAVLAAITISGCSASNNSQGATASTNAVDKKLFALVYSVPDNWEIKKDDANNGSVTYTPSQGGLMSVTMTGNVNFDPDADSYIQSHIKDIENGGTSVFGELSKSSLGNAMTYESSVTRTQDGKTYKGKSKFILSGHGLYWIIVVIPEASYDTGESTIQNILDSMKLSVDTSAPLGSSSSSTTQQQPTASTTPTVTTSQKNALSKAKSYLNSSAFSYTGLIKQLEYEKFSTEDATYGADNCGADWTAQADKKAASYMNSSSFSHGSLVDQLEYEGFTADQAEHGATSVGL